jgi:uncharacterized protein (TIGR00369 family)
MSGPGEDDALARFLGLRILQPGSIQLRVEPRLVNGIGLLLGPVAFALVDYAMGSAVWDGLAPGEAAATAGIAMTFLDSVNAGDVTCTATVDRRGGRLVAARAELRAVDDGRLLATAQGTFAVTRPRGAPADRPR